MTEWNGLPPPQRYWSALAMWLAIVMAVLDSSIANVALPAIGLDLHARASEAIWAVNAYQLATVVTILPLASLGEYIGCRRIFSAGLVLFVLASIGCTFAHTLPQLIAARAVQGLGASGVMSMNAALVRYTFPHSQLGRWVGINASVVSLAAIAGPSIASAILAVASWQWLFAVNIPIGALAIVVAITSLPESPRAGRPLDWVAALLNVVAFSMIVVGVDIVTRGGAVLRGVVFLIIGAVAATFLVLRSLVDPRPLLPLDLLKAPLFASATITSISSFVAQMLAMVSLPFFLEGPLHMSQVTTGLLITPWPLAVAIAAPLAGHLVDRYSAAVLSGLGLLALTAGLVSLAFLPIHPSALDIVWRMFLCGFGFGFFQAPNNRTMLSSSPFDRVGAAGGMLATARLTGQTVGATIAAILFRMSGHGAIMALVVAALFALTSSSISFSRLLAKPEPAKA